MVPPPMIALLPSLPSDLCVAGARVTTLPVELEHVRRHLKVRSALGRPAQLAGQVRQRGPILAGEVEGIADIDLWIFQPEGPSQVLAGSILHADLRHAVSIQGIPTREIDGAGKSLQIGGDTPGLTGKKPADHAVGVPQTRLPRELFPVLKKIDLNEGL
jgi:hypothetical protein